MGVDFLNIYIAIWLLIASSPDSFSVLASSLSARASMYSTHKSIDSGLREAISPSDESSTSAINLSPCVVRSPSTRDADSHNAVSGYFSLPCQKLPGRRSRATQAACIPVSLNTLSLRTSIPATQCSCLALPGGTFTLCSETSPWCVYEKRSPLRVVTPFTTAARIATTGATAITVVVVAGHTCDLTEGTTVLFVFSQ